MLLSVFAVPSFAAQAYPESDHAYADNTVETWTYTADVPADGLLVTFSKDTYVEPFAEVVRVPAESQTLTVGELFDADVKTGDYLALYDGNDALVGYYDGDALAGETVYVSGNSFSVTLVSDAGVSGYGFAIDTVLPIFDSDTVTVTYHSSLDGVQPYTRTYSASRPGYADDSYRGSVLAFDGIPADLALAGWATEEGGKIAYNRGDPLPADAGELELWAVWVKMALGAEEIFTFNNSKYYFVDENNQGYYISADDYRTMQLNLYKNFGPGPLPATIVSIVLSTYPNWSWRGSCYGMSTVAALQHFGLIDVLNLQNAENLSQMEADDALISFINYYQAQAASSWLTENKAASQGSPMYQTQLENMYKSVCDGNLVLFTFYPGTAFITTGHTVLLTGGYDDAEGNHVIVAYDCNRPYTYANGRYDSRFVISPDYTKIAYDGNEALGSFNWTDHYEQFTSFSIYNDGNPLTWYARWFSHFIEAVKAIFRSIAVLFRR